MNILIDFLKENSDSLLLLAVVVIILQLHIKHYIQVCIISESNIVNLILVKIGESNGLLIFKLTFSCTNCGYVINIT